jgi:MFS family permease
MKTKKKSYYFILIIFATFCLAFVAQGVANGTKGQYVLPITETFGWARTQYTAGMSIGDITMFLANVFFAVAVSRLKGIRNVFLVGGVLLIASFATFYFAHSLMTFYVGFALYGVAQAYINSTGYSAIVSSWFIKKKGTVLGLIFAGTGIGAVIWNMVVGYALQNQGWRQAYLYTIIASAILITIALVIMRNKPADVGMLPYGADATDESDSAKPKVVQELPGFTLKEALREPFYWVAGLGLALLVMTVMGVFVNAPGFLGSHGVTPIIIASVMSTYYIFATIGKVVGGMAIDKLGIKAVLTFCVLSYAVGTFILTRYTDGDPISKLYGFIVFFGFGFVTMSVPVPMIAHHLFGSKDFPAIMGTMMAFFSLGGIFAGPSGSLAFDILGSYVPAFYLYIGLAIVALLMLYLAMSMSAKKLKAKYPQAAVSSESESELYDIDMMP